MKTVSPVDASVMKGAAREKSPVKVCMHILRTARTDYRAMRSARALVKEGFEVSFIDVEYKRMPSVEEDIDGIRMKHIRMHSWQSARRFEPWFFVVAIRTFILSLLWLIRTPADIYHATEVTALPACFIAAQLRRKPLIFEAYELPPPLTDIAFWRRLNGVLTRLLAMILPRCAGVITTSPLYAQEIRKRFHVPEVSLVRNILAHRTVQKSDRLRQHLGLSPETRIALYQGGLQRNRGLDKLVRAAPFLGKDIVIVMMGEWRGTVQSEIETLIADEGLSDRVKIIPQVPYEDLLEWTASADIGLTILPPDYSLSIRMTLPNKLFEYLMAGLPILSSELDAVVEVIKTYDVGQIVSSAEPADIGAAINAMLADRAALARMRRNALEAAQRDLHWEKESQHLIHLYRDILARHNLK